MSLKSKIEAVIYAAEEPVTLQQLAGLLGEEAEAELAAAAANQAELALDGEANSAELSERSAEETGSGDAADEAGPEPEVALTAAGDDASVGEAARGDQNTVAGADVAAGADAVAGDEDANAAAQPEEAAEKRKQRERDRAVRDHLRRAADQLIREYAESDRGIEVREVAGGYRMGTKPEYHDAVRGFVKSLKPPLKLTLQALETLAVVAYKQPVTAAEISEIRGVDSAGVLGGLMTRKLIATAGRKQVIGRPMLYKTTKEFLLRFGLKDVNELPSMEEFEKMAGELNEQEDLPMESAAEIVERANARGDAELIREETAGEPASETAEPAEHVETAPAAGNEG